MVHLRVNEFFLRVNERREVNENSVPILCMLWKRTSILFFPKRKPAFVNKMANFKRSNITSAAEVKVSRNGQERRYG